MITRQIAAKLSEKAPQPDKAESVEEPFVPLPKELWALRRRFPSVTRVVLLQCTRCHRWVAQPVTRLEAASKSVVVESGTGLTTGSRTEVRRSRRGAQETDDARMAHEWRSPRLQRQYAKTSNDIADQKPPRALQSDSALDRRLYSIPNTNTFVCQWTYCKLEDVWGDLRKRWFGDLYRTVSMMRGDGVVHANNRSAANESTTAVRGRRRQHLKESIPVKEQLQLNVELTTELDGRCSERLFGKKSIDSALKGSSVNVQELSGYGQGSKVECMAEALICNDDVVLASFCWVSCDYCGKLRRVHQPFPGGAPFVCSLAFGIDSCDVPEENGIRVINNEIKAQRGLHEKSAIVAGERVLREVVGANLHASPHPGSDGANGERRGSRGGIAKDPLRTQQYAAAETSVPLIRSLTAALRRKALGAFVKQVVTDPNEVRVKREDVVKASFVDEVQQETEEVTECDAHEAATLIVPKVETLQEADKVSLEGSLQEAAQAPAEEKDNGDQEEAVVDSTVVPSGEGVNGSSAIFATNNECNNTTDGSAVSCTANKGVPRATRRLGCPPRNLQWTFVHDDDCKFMPEMCHPGVVLTSANSDEMTTARCRARWQTLKEMNAKQTASPPTDVPNSKEKEDIKNETEVTVVGDRSASSSATSESDEEDSAQRVIHWVCCDICDKWRIVPKKVPKGTKRWECHMRGDGTRCEDEDDWVKMKRSKRGRKRRRH
ncbi:putative CW type Zinc Finger [Trypanosoma vivax]|uniref:CW-type domain-containing protein n=1 Tax=Trypanosoma vivax (strain Y486) TaxID=1055687 RepID=G0U884_TRYVY|nr:hypothetical protein TRVL_02073 [Trypanosoma vivax]KAH8606932.1 putative CW type Zinc Finger [Trypanosoma vivax]CCC52094.1 conserved hypothetical protein [Trypanosoma vivax Y486]